MRLCPRRIYFTRAHIPAKDGLPVIAPARIGDSRASASADNTLSSAAAGCVWNRLPPEGRAPDTDGYDISEVRGDLRFSRPFIPILSLFSCFLFPVAATLLHLPSPHSPFLSHRLRIRSRQSFSSSLLFYFFSLPPLDLAFPSFVLFHPLVATPTAYIDSPQRLEEKEKEKMEKRERSLSLCLSTRIVFLFALTIFVPSSSERMSKTT